MWFCAHTLVSVKRSRHNPSRLVVAVIAHYTVYYTDTALLWSSAQFYSLHFRLFQQTGFLFQLTNKSVLSTFWLWFCPPFWDRKSLTFQNVCLATVAPTIVICMWTSLFEHFSTLPGCTQLSLPFVLPLNLFPFYLMKALLIFS